MKEKDFVIATRPINGIEVNSVGIIKSISQDEAQVYFIGTSRNVTVPIYTLCPKDVEKTGDRWENKICNVCHIVKSVEEFAINQTNAKGEKQRRPTCKSCRKVIDGRKIKDAEKRRLDAERQPDKTIFVCPICKKETVVGVTAKIVADHDHGTGMGRDWICDSCNTGLGRFKDNIVILEIAIEYLKRFENNESEDSDSIEQFSLFDL